MPARKIKLLAHDNKSGVGCLLNLPAASSRPEDARFAFLKRRWPIPDGRPLFWLELFDHGAKTSVDAFGCHEIDNAASILEDLILQAGILERSVRVGRF